MDDNKKFYLLAELSGWDCSKYIADYGEKIKNSNAYRVLKYNMADVEDIYTQNAYDLKKEYEGLNFNVNSIKECYLLEEKVNYLALHSDPRFYINPFSINPNYIGSINSLGDLMIPFKGEEKTINEIILDNETPIDEKKKEVENQVDYYLYDFENLVTKTILNTKSKTNEERVSQNKFIRRAIIKLIIDFSMVFFLVILYCFPNNLFFSNLYDRDYSKILTYISIIYPIITLLALLIDTIFYSYRSRIYEPINYARRFLKKNNELLFQSIRKRKEDLLDYIFGAIKNRIKLINDLCDYSMLSSSYVSLEKIVNIEKEIKQLKYKRLSDISNSMSYVSISALVFSIVIYVVSYSINLVI